MKNSKRVLALLCALVLMLSVGLVGCGSDAAEEEAAAASTGIWDGVSYDIQMQCHQSSTEQIASSYDHMIGLIDQVTGGAVKITAFESGSLYSTADCFNAVSSGELVMCEATEGSWSDTIPVSLIGAGVPYIYSSYEQAYMFMYNRGFYDLLNEAYAQYNIHVIPYECYTAGLMTKSPITSIDDFQGLKLRASGTMAKFEDLIGAAVTSVAANELYSALSQGLIDGVTWGAAQAMVQMNFQEVCNYYLAVDPIIGQWNCLYFNLDWWNALTEDQQNELEATITMAGYHRTIATEANNDLVKNTLFADAGVELLTLDSATQTALADYGMQLVETLGQADDYSARAVQMLSDFVAEFESGDLVYNNDIYFNYAAPAAAE